MKSLKHIKQNIVILFIFFFSAEFIYKHLGHGEQMVPWDYLPSNFTFLPSNSLYTNKALSLLIQYDLSLDPYYNDQLVKLKGIIDELQNFYKNPYIFKFYLKPSTGKGMGVFAAQDIPAFMIVGEYRGIVTTDEIGNFTYTWYFLPEESKYYETSLKKLGIDSKYYGDGWMRFVNDGFPNLIPFYVPSEFDGIKVWKIVYRTLKEIKTGEELIISYGDEYWESRNFIRKKEV